MGVDEGLTTFDESDGVALLTLQRAAKRNALSQALRGEIVRRLDEALANDAVRVVVLTGAAPAFCAGFDRDELAAGGGGGAGEMEAVFADSAAYHRRVYGFEKPLVAAVNGPALGGGCDLAAMCDFRLAATTAVFGQPQVRFGAPAAYDLMCGVLGRGAAREMCLTGRRYDAPEALALGLVSRVLDPGDLVDAALGVAREIAALPDGVARAAKAGFLAEQPPLFGS